MKNIKKGETLKDVKKAVEIANKMNWTHRENFIIGHPYETYKKAMDTIRFASELSSSFVTCYTARPYPGTELFEYIKKNGKFIYTPEFYLNNIEEVDGKPIFETKEFSKSEREKVLYLGKIMSRKKYLQFILGDKIGNFALFFLRYDKIWFLTLTIFQGTKIGYTFFDSILKRITRRKGLDSCN